MHAKNYIQDPLNKAKSIAFTDKGLDLSAKLSQ